jgi:hypothetical protein
MVEKLRSHEKPASYKNSGAPRYNRRLGAAGKPGIVRNAPS